MYKRQEDIQAEFALIYNTSYEEKLLSFANNISTPEGGTHVSGFRQALTRAVNEYARKQGLLKECDSSLSRDELSEGMVAIVSVRLKDPQFEGQTKQKLGSSSARPVSYTHLDVYKRQASQTQADPKGDIQVSCPVIVYRAQGSRHNKGRKA